MFPQGGWTEPTRLATGCSLRTDVRRQQPQRHGPYGRKVGRLAESRDLGIDWPVGVDLGAGAPLLPRAKPSTAIARPRYRLGDHHRPGKRLRHRSRAVSGSPLKPRRAVVEANSLLPVDTFDVMLGYHVGLRVTPILRNLDSGCFAEAKRLFRPHGANRARTEPATLPLPGNRSASHRGCQEGSSSSALEIARR